ncbi:uncharacterized protein G2W53_013787 [Senna tora]|uniref:Uncharacterized protein n=1 Tax=Senna tora TaxID=362788 RepID=A0A834WSU2_9FABA|nr:uncharacterized protein G2W53_013787 [Senna tora]
MTNPPKRTKEDKNDSFDKTTREIDNVLNNGATVPL